MCTTIESVTKQHLNNYINIKQKYPDAVLLFRLADDYVTFHTDAEIVQRLTGNDITDLQDIGKVCSFPFSEMDDILHKLVKAGNRVAVCDQLEN